MTPTATHPSSRRRRGPLLTSAVAFSLGGAAVYLAVLPALLQANLVGGVLFAAAGIAQASLAVGLTTPTRRKLVAAAAVSLAVVAVWLLHPARDQACHGPLPATRAGGPARTGRGVRARRLEDVNCAVRFLRAHASSFGIDPGRIGAWGSSGGGALVSLLGLAGPEAGFDHGQYAEQSSAVQAVVDMFGPADLTDLGDSEPFARVVAGMALGSSAGVLRSASPLSYVGSGAGAAGGGPPFLILHGTDDQGIRPRQSQELARRLDAAGVPVRLVLVQGADHGLNDPSQRPTPGQLTEMVADFFDRSLARTTRHPTRTNGPA